VQLLNGSRPTIPEILPAQFYQSLADNMRTWLLTTSASRITTAKAASEDASIYKQLLYDLELLDPSTWNVDTTIVDGDPAITRLCRVCRRFKLDVRTAIDRFRDFFGSSSVNVPEKLAPLRRAVECLVVSTAE
jgi:hypothetical protein